MQTTQRNRIAETAHCLTEVLREMTKTIQDFASAFENPQPSLVSHVATFDAAVQVTIDTVIAAIGMVAVGGSSGEQEQARVNRELAMNVRQMTSGWLTCARVFEGGLATAGLIEPVVIGG
jgi:hypothetical protein